MVAIVSGNNLGLSLSSLSTLGQRGLYGTASQGRSGEATYVNIANGNVVIQDRDDGLVATGLNLNVLRTYNSQGQFSDDNGDNWLTGLNQSVALSGTRMAVGSSIALTNRDGAVGTYQFDVARGLYVSTGGGGAFDTIGFDSQSGQYVWTDGTTGRQDFYEGDGAGRILSSRDPSGNTLTYAYGSNGLLKSVQDASGESTYFDYSGANLIQIRNVILDNGTPKELTSVRYTYDASNRLSTVTVDLTPGDDSIADGNVYKTTYTYDGTSKRVASITQSDGTSLAFTYAQYGSDYRVASVTDAAGEVTTFAYITATQQTIVKDPLGTGTIYTYDAQGQLTSVASSPDGATSQTTNFSYTANGDLTQVVDPEGRTLAMQYDANGNQILQRDSLGNTIERVFDGRNKVLTETVYLTPSPDSSGTSQPTVPKTTRYVYDAANRNLLRFVISPEGRVTEYRYDAAGDRTSSRQYSGASYDTSTLQIDATPTEAQMAAWTSLQDQTRTSLSEMNYDFRGQLQRLTTYASVAADGTGAAEGAETTQYVYDQSGRLLKSISSANGVTQYNYDGLGRVIAAWDALNQVTLTQYDDANNKTVVQQANGLVTTNVFDKAGRLVAMQQAGPSGVLGTTTYTYDADGRLRVVQEPTGVRQWRLYDDIGRKVADIDGTGTLTEYAYNKAGQITETIVYGTRVDPVASGLLATDGTPANVPLSAIRPAVSASDSRQWQVYDNSGRLVYTVDAAGAVTESRYDGASRVVAVIRYANAIDISAFGGVVVPSAITPVASAADRVLRNFYDGDGLLRATLDAEGYLSEIRYDSAGRAVERVRHAAETPAALRASGTLDQLLPVASVDDQHTVYLYNARGQLTAEIDPEGYLTETVYDANGNVAQSIRYATRVTVGVSAASTLMSIRPASSVLDRSQSWSYDPLGRVVSETNAEGTQTNYTYDSQGNRTSISVAMGTADLRTTNVRYDIQGRLIAELSGAGAAQLTGNLTQGQIDVIWAQYGIKYTYDAAGRRTSSVDALGNTTLFFYDNDSRLAYTISPVGGVEERTYTAAGQLASVRAYRSVYFWSAASGIPAGGLVTPALQQAVAALRRDDLDVVTTYSYKATGSIATVTDTLGNATSYDYDVFGEEVARHMPGSNGQTVTTTTKYDRLGHVVETNLDPTGLGLVNSITYDAFGRTVSNIDPNGNARTSTYDRLGRIVQVADALGGKRVSTYDAFARALTESDELGHTTTYAYSDTERSVTITLPGGVSTRTVHNREGQTVSVIDGNGHMVSYQYDANGNLVKTSTDLAATSNTYDVANHLISTTDANGNTIAYQYDAAGRMIVQRVDPRGLNLMTVYRFDVLGNRIRVTNPAGQQTLFVYDQKGRVLEQRVLMGGGAPLSTQYTYDGQGNTLTVLQPNGSVTRYTYDAAGRRIMEQVDPTGLNLTRTYTYDKDGNVVVSTDANGNVSRFVYDANNRQVFKLDALGNTTQTVYDATGRVIKTTTFATPIDLSSLSATPSVADVSAKLVSVAAHDVSETHVFDVDGHLRFSVDGTGAVTEYRYDANGNVTERVAYANRIALSSWDGKSPPTVVADAAHDQDLRTVYDALNRAIYTIDGTGTVTSNTYDGNGNVIDRTTYATPVPVTTEASADALADAVAQVAAAGKDARSRTEFDAANRPVWTADGTGAVTQRVYDGAGHVIKLIRYATPVTASSKPSQVTPSSADVATVFAYDLAGRQILQVDALGGVVEQVYDSNSNVVQRISYGTALAGSVLPGVLAAPTQANIRAAIQANSAVDRVTRYAYDAVSRLVLTLDAQGAVVETQFDAAGNAVATRSYANRIDTTGFSPAAKPAEIRGRLTTDAANDRVVVNAFDAANRQVYTVDALGYVKQTDYDGTGAITKTTQYAQPIPASNALTTAAIGAAIITEPSADRTNIFVSDAAGRLISSTDPLGYSESYAYNGLGQKTSFTNKNGATWAYDYDAAGRLVRESDPAVNLTTVGLDANGNLVPSQTNSVNLVTRLAYDALGNLIARTEAAGTASERTTRYEYDALGRQIKAIFPPVGVYSEALSAVAANGASGSAARNETVRTLTTQTFYDALGNAVVGKDVADNSSAKVYDALGRVLYEIDPEGYVTGYTRDAFGEVTSLTRYATRTNLVATSITSAGQAPTRAAVEAAINAAGVDHSRDRAILTSYDQLGRVTKVIEPLALVYDSSAAVNTQYFSAGKTTKKTYNAFGDVIQQSQLQNAVTNAWTTTTSYFDRRGQQVATVDALGYLTTKSYDAAGNVVATTEFANALAQSSWSLSAYGTPTASQDDRTTEFSFDQKNRKISETRRNVEYSEAADGNSTRGNLTTSYGYDGVGNQVVVTDAFGATTYSYYDALGRVTAVTGAARPSAGDGSTLIPLTLYQRDAYGNVTTLITTARGAASATAAGYAAAGPDGADRTITTRYDLQGHAVEVRDATGVSTYTSYNERGQVAKTWQTTTGNDGTSGTLFKVFEYDKLGQLTHTFDPAPTSVLQGGLQVSWSSASTGKDEAGKILISGQNQINLSWSSLVDPSGGIVRVQVDYVTIDSRYVQGVDESGVATIGGVASHPASRTVDFGAAQAAAGATVAWADSSTNDGGISQLAHIRVWQLEGGQWVSKWDGSPAQANGSGIGTLPQAQAGLTDTAFEYDAFGEITSKGVDGGRQEYFDYDNAGHLWRTNSGDGVDRISLFDLSGNVTADIRSAGSGWNDDNIHAVTDEYAAAGMTYARRTDTRYDARGRKVSTVGPERLDQQSGVVSRQNFANSSITGSAIPTTNESSAATWSGTNEIRLSWTSLAALGNGSIKVVVDYQTQTYSYSDGTIGPGGTNESGQPLDENGHPIVHTHYGVAASRTQILTAEQGANGTVLAWQDGPGADGGVAGVTHIRVYKEDVDGQWVQVLDQTPGLGSGNIIEVAAPTDPKQATSLQIRAAGSPGDTGWTNVPVTNFGDALRYDTASLSAGNYEYRVLTTSLDQTTRVTSTGSLSLSAPPLAAIGAPMSYGSATLSWQNPGSGIQQVLHYRVAGSGSGWSTLPVTDLGGGLSGVADTSALAPGAYEFELLWSHTGESAPFAHGTGQFTRVAGVPGYWVPQVNYPPIAVTLTDGLVGGTITGHDEAGNPVYARDESGNIPGQTTAKVLQWSIPSQGANVAFQYRVAGSSSWGTLPVWTYLNGTNESGTSLGDQRVDISSLSAGNFEYQVIVTDASGNRIAQATGNLTVNAQGAGHYETQSVQVQVPVTVTPPDPSNYITGWTKAQYGAPVVVGTDESGNPILGANYAWQGNVVVGVPYTQSQVVGYQQEAYTVQVPTQGSPIISGYDESGNPIYAHDESGNIQYTTVWVTQTQWRTVPVYGSVTVNPPDPSQYMTVPSKPIYGPPVVVGTDESSNPILGEHYVRQGSTIVAVPYTVYQTQTQQQQVWIAGATPPPTMTSTTPPYTPAYYVDPTPSYFNISLNTTTSVAISIDAVQSGGVLSEAAQQDGDVRWVRPTINQKLDRWGNVIEITDPRSPNWKTTYRYNANNQAVEVHQPDADGNQTANGPVTRMTYDRLGRQLSQTDANGNITGKVYDQAGNLTAERHGDGNSVQYRYDAFGDKIAMIDALGRITGYTYDHMSRLLAVRHAQVDVRTVDGGNSLQDLGWQNLVETYTYDQAGRKLSQTDGAGETVRYRYDMRGNLVATTQPLGQTTLYGYDAQGHKTIEVDPTSMAATWSYDYFGAAQHHTDIGGASYSYSYDFARQLVTQTNTRGQSLHYTYDAAGQVIQIRDDAIDQTTTYAYNLAGSHVRERTVQGGVVYQNNFLAYDALGRLRDVADGDVHITIDYDKVGNRTHIGTHAMNGDTSSDSDRWFQYDNMNRQIVVDAIDQSGDLGTQGHRIGYDANGNRTSDQYWGNQVITTGGQQVIVGYDEGGSAIYTTTPVTYVRQQGLTQELYSYDNMDRLTSVVRDGVQVDHRYYDGASRLVQTGPAGNLPQGYADKLNEGVPQGLSNGLETRISRYDANGRLLHQTTLKSDNSAKSDIDYTSYDAAGNVLQYVVQDHENDYTNTYSNTLTRYEGYKASVVSGTSTQFDPGSTTSRYDANGNLIRIDDSTKIQNDRTLVNDVAGHVLAVNQGGNIERELVVNGEVLGQHGMGINPVTPQDGNGNPNFTNLADFNFGYQPIVSSYPNASTGSYTVQSGDTLQSIARSAYGDSALWYRIAEANGLSSDRDVRVGQTLNIPSLAAGAHNNTGVFKPYDPSKVVGDTTPNLPMPSGDSGCGPVGQIVMIVVAIVVTIYTAGAAAGAFSAAEAGAEAGAAGAAEAGAGAAEVGAGAAEAGAATSSIGSTFGAGLQVMQGVYGLPGLGYAAIGGVAGSVASQAVGNLIGAQHGFNWGAVAMSGISAGAGAGAASVFGSGIATAALTSAATQGIGVATGLQHSFNWRSVAAAAAGAAAGSAVDAGLGAVGGDILGSPAGQLIGRTLSSLAAGVTTAAMRGGRVDIVSVATDAFGNALGSSLAAASTSQPAWDGTLYGSAPGYSYLDKTPVTGMFVWADNTALQSASVDAPAGLVSGTAVGGMSSISAVAAALTSTGGAPYDSIATQAASAVIGSGQQGVTSDAGGSINDAHAARVAELQAMAGQALVASDGYNIGGGINVLITGTATPQSQEPVGTGSTAGLANTVGTNDLSIVSRDPNTGAITWNTGAVSYPIPAPDMSSQPLPPAFGDKIAALSSEGAGQAFLRGWTGGYAGVMEGDNPSAALMAGKYLREGWNSTKQFAYDMTGASAFDAARANWAAGDYAGAAVWGAKSLTDAGMAVFGLGAVRPATATAEAVDALATTGSPAWKGAGPVPGTFGVGPTTESVAGLRNYYPKQGSIEFVFDPDSSTFVVGRAKVQVGSPHESLASSIGADPSRVVGGMFTRTEGGGILTNEFSGHYWQNWTPQVRQQFSDFMNSRGLPTVHREGM